MANRKLDPYKHLGTTKVDQRNEKATYIVKEKVCVLRHYKIDKDMTNRKKVVCQMEIAIQEHQT